MVIEVEAVAFPQISKDKDKLHEKYSFAAGKTNFKDTKKKCFCSGSLDDGQFISNSP